MHFEKKLKPLIIYMNNFNKSINIQFEYNHNIQKIFPFFFRNDSDRFSKKKIANNQSVLQKGNDLMNVPLIS